MHQPTLLLPLVTLEISFADLLGDKALDVPAHERRIRWAQRLRLSRAAGSERAAGRYWTDSRECSGCKHRRGTWCQLQQLPCTVNPILSYRHGAAGMACMGAGREPQA